MTPDLVADLKRFKGEIVHLFETEGELPVPSECPAWREFRLHAWKPAMMVPTSVRPFRKWVPYTTGVCGDKTIQMYISVDPRPHGYVKGGGFHATGTGWRWSGEETWRPMPKGVIGG